MTEAYLHDVDEVGVAHARLHRAAAAPVVVVPAVPVRHHHRALQPALAQLRRLRASNLAAEHARQLLGVVLHLSE